MTHVDASKKSVSWARENQALSNLTEKPIRWIVDDALKFVQREARRGVKYDGIILDPPKFGRGPKGEVWEVYKSLPDLLEACRECLSDDPLFVVTTIYAVRASAIHVAQAMEDMMNGFGERSKWENWSHASKAREDCCHRLCMHGGKKSIDLASLCYFSPSKIFSNSVSHSSDLSQRLRG